MHKNILLYNLKWILSSINLYVNINIFQIIKFNNILIFYAKQSAFKIVVYILANSLAKTVFNYF
jgi:hypothetical protein